MARFIRVRKASRISWRGAHLSLNGGWQTDAPVVRPPVYGSPLAAVFHHPPTHTVGVKQREGYACFASVAFKTGTAAHRGVRTTRRFRLQGKRNRQVGISGTSFRTITRKKYLNTLRVLFFDVEFTRLDVRVKGS
jgi:hypothetical protein